MHLGMTLDPLAAIAEMMAAKVSLTNHFNPNDPEGGEA